MHDDLETLGLKRGDVVRWRPSTGARWRTGRVTRRERDGSVAVTDANGHARSMTADRLEVSCAGRRGARTWEVVTFRAGRAEQLRLI